MQHWWPVYHRLNAGDRRFALVLAVINYMVAAPGMRRERSFPIYNINYHTSDSDRG